MYFESKNHGSLGSRSSREEQSPRVSSTPMAIGGLSDAAFREAGGMAASGRRAWMSPGPTEAWKQFWLFWLDINYCLFRSLRDNKSLHQ